MAFSFGRSNLQNLARMPVAGAVFLVSMITPRRANLWVFGRKGMFGGNSRYLMEYVRERRPDIDCVWLAHSDKELEEARAAGVRAERASSWRGWALSLRAKVGVVSLGFGDVNRAATGGMFVVQLWHGLPLKKLGLDSPVTTTVDAGIFRRPLEYLIQKIYRFTQSRYGLFTAPSEIASIRYQSAFALRQGCVALTGEPKTDIILGPNDEGPCAQWQTAMRERFGIAPGTTIIMYAPTWREEGSPPLLPNNDLLAKLEKLLAKNGAHLIIRGHYANEENGISNCLRSNISIMSSDDFPDVNYLLSGISILISDYSGIMMDFALLERPIIFFAPDLESYEKTRGLYESYETFTGGAWATNWESLISEIEACLTGEPRFAANAARLSSRYNGHIDLDNRKRVYEEIIRRLRLSAPSHQDSANRMSH